MNAPAAAAEYERVLNWMYDKSKLRQLHLKATCAPHYFRILRDKSDKIWPRIKTEKQIGVRWPGYAESDFQLALYLILPG